MAAPEEPRRCETLRDVQALSGQRVTLAGTYRQVDLRMRRKPPPVYTGRVAVVLDDGTKVLLEPNWSEAGARGPEELERYDGERVEATGVVHSRSPKPPEPIAYITGPCLSPVEDVRPASREDAPH